MQHPCAAGSSSHATMARDDTPAHRRTRLIAEQGATATSFSQVIDIGVVRLRCSRHSQLGSYCLAFLVVFFLVYVFLRFRGFSRDIDAPELRRRRRCEHDVCRRCEMCHWHREG